MIAIRRGGQLNLLKKSHHIMRFDPSDRWANTARQVMGNNVTYVVWNTSCPVVRILFSGDRATSHA